METNKIIAQKEKLNKFGKFIFNRIEKNYASKNNLAIHLHTPTYSTYTVYVLSLA